MGKPKSSPMRSPFPVSILKRLRTSRPTERERLWEIRLRSQLFRKPFAGRETRKQFCAIGSVKTNVGHLDTAAGVTGLIKTVCALRHGQLPPSLNFIESEPED